MAQPEGELYRRIKLLGEGSFGKAYLVECLKDSTKCVIKQMDLSEMSEEEKRETIKEAKILELFKHPNIIRFREVYKTKRGKLCIVMEYAEGGDLQKKIKDQNGQFFSENQILDWFTQMCLALKHVHDRKIIHRDLKSPNIFLTKDNTVKLGDFGIARVLSHTKEKAKTIVGTPYYLSPEIIEGRDYTFKTDLWSLGVILYELCALSPPFKANNLSFLALKIVKGNYTPIPACYSGDLSSIIAKLLNVDPNKRPSVHDILGLPVITSRIKNFLSDTLRSNEFSHTIIHNKKFFENKGREIEPIKQQLPSQGPLQYSPRVKNIPQIDSKANIANKQKPATPNFNNINNNNNNNNIPTNNNLNNNKNQINKINANNKKSPIFKEIAEREFKQKEIQHFEEKKEIPKKIQNNNNNNINANQPAFKQKNNNVAANLKKNPPPPEPIDQGGILCMPNFCEKKQKEKKKIVEKKEVEIPQKKIDPKEKEVNSALKRQEKEKEREDQRKKMIEDMKKKAKQKEETKEITIEWYGQIIPVENKKKPLTNKEIIEEPPKLPPVEELKKPLETKKAISYEIIDRKENLPPDNINETEIKIEENERIEETNKIFEDKIIEEKKEIVKPREKWNKSNEELKNFEKNDQKLQKKDSSEYKNDDDYIEQMINELQEIVDGVNKVIDSKDWVIPEEKLNTNIDRDDDDILDVLEMKESEKIVTEELKKLLVESLDKKMDLWGIENIYQIYEKKNTEYLAPYMSDEEISKFLPLLLTLIIMEKEN